jgi:hypothetical protein
MQRPATNRAPVTTPKLSLRDLFAVMTIVALALGWWLDHRKIKHQNDEMAIEMKDLQHYQLTLSGLAEENSLLLHQQQMLRAMVEDMGYEVHFFENGVRLSPTSSSRQP